MNSETMEKLKRFRDSVKNVGQELKDGMINRYNIMDVMDIKPDNTSLDSNPSGSSNTSTPIVETSTPIVESGKLLVTDSTPSVNNRYAGLEVESVPSSPTSSTSSVETIKGQTDSIKADSASSSIKVDNASSLNAMVEAAPGFFTLPSDCVKYKDVQVVKYLLKNSVSSKQGMDVLKHVTATIPLVEKMTLKLLLSL